MSLTRAQCDTILDEYHAVFPHEPDAVSLRASRILQLMELDGSVPFEKYLAAVGTYRDALPVVRGWRSPEFPKLVEKLKGAARRHHAPPACPETQQDRPRCAGRVITDDRVAEELARARSEGKGLVVQALLNIQRRRKNTPRAQ